MSLKAKAISNINLTNRLLSHNWLVYKIHDECLRKKVEAYAKGKLLDIGCGEKPYAKMLKPYVAEHVGVDHEGTLHDKSNIDRFGSAYEIPAEDNEFDSVICTSVLEHLEEPDKAIAECNRVLKTGGVAIYATDLFWHLHEEPRDFYRYTKYGLRYLFEKNGFEVLELIPLSGFCVTFGQELVYYLWRFRRGGKLNPLWWIIPVIGTIIQGVCYLLNKIDHSEQFTWAYLLVATKVAKN
jgi:ubiquinone/menaquinone biosynthesis C-methylase UbiE